MMATNTQAGSVPSPDTIRAVTREIIQRPEFDEPAAWRETLLTLMNQIRDWLNSLSSWANDNPDLARFLFILAVVVLIACVAHLFYLTFADVFTFRRNRRLSTKKTPNWKILEGTATNWQAALQLARTSLREGDTRRAVWIAHRVLLALLDQQGAIKFAGWKTNNHYVKECAAGHPWRGTFVELTELYERAVYASREIGAQAIEPLFVQLDHFSREQAG